MYFQNFPTIAYDPTGNKTFQTVSDILIRVVAKATVKTKDVLFTKYQIMENETPESVAYHYYGKSENKDTKTWCGWHLDHGVITGLVPFEFDYHKCTCAFLFC